LSRIYKYFGVYISVIYDILLYLSSIILLNAYKRNESKISHKKKILILAKDGQWRTVKDNNSGRLIKTDYFFNPILSELNNKYDLVGIYPLGIFPLRGLKIFRDKLKNWFIPHRTLNEFWTLNSSIMEFKSIHHFKRIFNDIKTDPILKNLCENNNISYEGTLNELNIYFIILYPHLVKYIQMARDMIKKEKPSMILLYNEHSRYERAFIIAAKLEGVPTIAFQHGIIHTNHKSYSYTNDEIDLVLDIKFPFSPIADKTLVYGPYYKEFLTSVSSFPEESVIITGNPRHDFLYHADKIYSRQDYLEKYKIPHGEKIVLWTTQCADLSEKENIDSFNTVFQVIEKLDNVVLIIKPHPEEPFIYTKMIQEIIKNYNINAIIPPKDSDIYEHLNSSDLLIVKDSTTVIEAVILKKPIIILNLDKKQQFSRYVDEKIALGAYNAKQLMNSIIMLLEDSNVLMGNHGKFIRKYLYKIDGQSVDRVIEIIDRMI